MRYANLGIYHTHWGVCMLSAANNLVSNITALYTLQTE